MKKKITAITVFLMTTPALVFANTWGGGPCWDESFFGGHHGYGGHFFGGGIFMWILNILLLGAVIFIAVKFFRGGGHGGEKPLNILKQRLAKGEITKEEFDSLKKEL